MGFIITDGTGTGTSAEVDKENRLRSFVDTRTQIAFVSEEKEQAFVINTGQLPVTTTNGLMLFILNTSQTKSIHISNIFLSWTGGNTNHDRVCFAQLASGISTPTGNEVVNVGGNLNSGSGNRPDATILHWDGVGTGMTGSSGGGVAADALFGRGFTQIPFNDAFIVKFNDSIGINLQGEEVGTAAIVLSMFFIDN